MLVSLFIFLQLQSAFNDDFIMDARNTFLEVNTLEVAELKRVLWLQSEDSIVQAYGACMYFMEARYAKNPITKWSRFKKGKKILENLIDENPENMEMRYLRFLFQNKMPEFLGYHSNREEDLEFILQQIDTFQLETRFKCEILNNVLQIEQLTSNQKLELNKKLKICS